MKLKKWKDTYPTASEYYDSFHDSEEGKKVWELAYDANNKDWDEESDEEEPVVIAHDIVIDGMESWLLNDVEENEYEKASKWFETLREDLSESIYAGLT